jgi:HTH-type transcriptional regulator / antitoxin HipB
MSTIIRSPETLGNAIRNARKQRGLSQARLAELVGLRQAAISLIEKGHAPLKLDTLLTILAALDLDLNIGPRTMVSVQDIVDLY